MSKRGRWEISYRRGRLRRFSVKLLFFYQKKKSNSKLDASNGIWGLIHFTQRNGRYYQESLGELDQCVRAIG